MSYCTSGFGAIIRHDLCALLSLPRVLPRWVRTLNPSNKSNTCSMKLFGRLSYEKSRGTITQLHTWWQDGRHNRFLFTFPWFRLKIRIQLYLITEGPLEHKVVLPIGSYDTIHISEEIYYRKILINFMNKTGENWNGTSFTLFLKVNILCSMVIIHWKGSQGKELGLLGKSYK